MPPPTDPPAAVATRLSVGRRYVIADRMRGYATALVDSCISKIQLP